MLELEHRFRVVDVHATLHVGEDSTARGRAVSPDRLERELHQAGIVRAVVFPPAREEGYLRANNAVARLSVERPFVALARLTGPRDPRGGAAASLRTLATRRRDHHTTPKDVEQYAYDDRFHGFKCNPVADGLPDERVLDRLAEVGLPVLVHGGEEFPPSAIADTLLEWSFPVVVAHFGGYPMNRELMNETVDLLGEYDDCYVDTSHVRYRDVLERALLEHPDRVLFGTGTPATHPNVALMEVLTLDVSEDRMRRVFSKNPARVIEALGPA